MGPKGSKIHVSTKNTKPKPTAKHKPLSPAVRAARKSKQKMKKLPTTPPPNKRSVCSRTTLLMLILHEEIPSLHQIANAFLIVIVNRKYTSIQAYCSTNTVYLNLYKYINLNYYVKLIHNRFNLAHKDDNYAAALSIADFLHSSKYQTLITKHQTARKSLKRMRIRRRIMIWTLMRMEHRSRVHCNY